MKVFWLFYRVTVFFLLLLITVYALEIFSITRNWIVFLVPVFFYFLILIIFKILKKMDATDL